VAGLARQTFELIAGERRLRAAQLAGVARIPAVLVEIDDREAAAWALVENVQRVELGAMEKARGYQRLVEQFKMTHQQVAEAVGERRTMVTNYVRLAELEAQVQSLIEEGLLSFGHAKVLLSAPTGTDRAALADLIVRGGHSVRAAERFVELTGQGVEVHDLEARAGLRLGEGPASSAVTQLDRGGGGDGGAGGGGVRRRTRKTGAGGLGHGPGGAAALEGGRPELRDIERQLGEQLGTRVRVVQQRGKEGGTIELTFYALAHFEGLLERMGVRLRRD
jgi:ParB/RepB/Spo0J family partition protein